MAKPDGVPPVPDSEIPRPFFTVITVCRNAMSCIEPTAISLLEQQFSDWEWVVVDGASTDGTVAAVTRLAAGDPRVRIISEKDSGIFNAMNKGARLSRGHYLHFLNADDSYTAPTVLRDVWKEWADHGAPDYMYGNIIVKFPDGRADWLERPAPVSGAMAAMVCGCLPHQATFARRELFEQHPGSFDESLRTAGDYKWMLEAVSSPKIRLHYMDRAICNYADGGASANLEKALPETFKVINQATAFHEALGIPNILTTYQEYIKKVRHQLEKAYQTVRDIDKESNRRRDESEARRAELERTQAQLEQVRLQHAETKKKLLETKGKLQEYKAKVTSFRERLGKAHKRLGEPLPADVHRRTWLPRWLRSRNS